MTVEDGRAVFVDPIDVDLIDTDPTGCAEAMRKLPEIFRQAAERFRDVMPGDLAEKRPRVEQALADMTGLTVQVSAHGNVLETFEPAKGKV
jgi:hypothetical protein